jgi:alpha-galactosidase
LGASPERLALLENADLLDMVRLGRASTPIDLLSYAPEDQQPSVFLLEENARQAMLTVFNWTEESHTRVINLAQLGLKGHYTAVDVLGDEVCCNVAAGMIELVQKPLGLWRWYQSRCGPGAACLHAFRGILRHCDGDGVGFGHES